MIELRIYSKTDIEKIAKQAVKTAIKQTEERLRKEFKFKMFSEHANAVPDETSVVVLDPSIRVANCLFNNDIKTIGELCELTEGDLLRWRNFGHRSIKEVIRSLENVGRTLRQPVKIVPQNLPHREEVYDGKGYKRLMSKLNGELP